jgi:hypothetical protein
VPTPEGDTTAGRVEWLGVTEQRAQDLLAAPADPDERSAHDEAVTWLKTYFDDSDRGGAESATAVMKAARADGIAERTLQRARRDAGVTTGRTAAGWVWTCDPTDARQGAKRPTW